MGSALSDGAKKQLDAVLGKWSQSYPAEYWTQKADALEQRGMLKSSRIRTALKHQQVLWRQILANVELTAKERAALKKQLAIFVPMPT